METISLLAVVCSLLTSMAGSSLFAAATLIAPMNHHGSTPLRPSPILGRRRCAGFTLIEGLVAGAILLITVLGFYSAFLRVNDYAASSRCSSSACVLLEQATNLALTTDWTSDQTAIPLVLQLTQGLGPNGGDWVTFDLPGQPGNGNGTVLLFIDPNGSGINVPGTLERRVLASNDPGGPSNTLLQVSFRITYTFHGLPPVVLVTSTMRARDN